MYEAQSLFYVAAITLCIFCMGLLRKSGRTSSRFILALLAVEAVCFLFEWLMIHPHSPAKSLWLGALMTTSFLSAPLLWLAARELILDKRINLRKLGKGHYLIILTGFILCLPLLSTTHGGVEYANPDNVASKAWSLFIHGAMLVCIIAYAFQVPFYLIRTYKLIVGHSDVQQKYHAAGPASLRSIRFLILILCSAWMLGILRTVHCIVPGESSVLQLLFTFSDVGVTIGVLFMIVSQVSKTTLKQKPTASEAAQYKKSPLNEETRSRILKKLNHAMESEQLYCDNLLSLRSLSTHIKESPHYVSQVLNQELNTNFYGFVNTYRIEHAKRELVEAPHRNVLEIALQVGFNSKSTFNTAFRRITQTTPSQYRSGT